MNHPTLGLEGASSPPTGLGVRLPRQARSRASFKRIVTAAMDLLAEKGLEGAMVQEVLSRARAGAGTFYARFDSRDALLAYLANRFWEDAREGWETMLAPDRWSAASVGEIVSQFTRMLVLWSRTHGSVLRAFLLHAMAHPNPKLLDRMAELDNQVADHLMELIMERGEALGHPEPDRAVRLATLQVFATLRSRYIFTWGVGEDGIEDSDLAAELATVFLRYLGLPTAVERSGEGTNLGARAGGAHVRG